jgi:hypothetical protein
VDDHRRARAGLARGAPGPKMTCGRRSNRHDRRMARRGHGTGQLYVKHDAYYGRWRTLDGRKLNRKIGAVRADTGSGGLTRSEAERQFRKVQRPRIVARSAAAPSGTHSTRPRIRSVGGWPSRARASRTCRTASRCSAFTSPRGWVRSPLTA